MKLEDWRDVDDDAMQRVVWRWVWRSESWISWLFIFILVLALLGLTIDQVVT